MRTPGKSQVARRQARGLTPRQLGRAHSRKERWFAPFLAAYIVRRFHVLLGSEASFLAASTPARGDALLPEVDRGGGRVCKGRSNRAPVEFSTFR
ncbi:MAG: hypothetical protein AAF317_04290, partial [Pseudomonadota bacterium]